MMDARTKSHRALVLAASWATLGLIVACGFGNGGDGGGDAFELAPGFTPETASGTAGGTIEAATRMQNCRGYIGNSSNHTVTLTEEMPLRIAVTAEQDTTLLVQTEDGAFSCDDDGGGNLNPLLDETFPAGTHRIWVGSYSEGESPPYSVQFSPGTGGQVQGAVGGGTTTPAGGGSNDMVPLSTGFRPDPHVLRGTAGGNVDASSLNRSCRGHVTATPQHTLVLQTGFNTLRLIVNSGSNDSTLVVRDLNGNFYCSDDDGVGFNPLIQQTLAPGSYQVWVGSYAADQQFPYVLGVSELASIDANYPGLAL